MKIQVQEIILECLRDLNEVLNKPELDHPDKDTRLYGPKGVLDSLNLVALISDIEGKISDEYDIHIVIADEKALSESRTPFKNVQTFTDYIERLIQGKADA